MAITVDWANAIINVPRDDMPLVQSTPTEIRELNLNDFRLTLKALESSLEGMGFQKMLDHYTAIQVGGVELAHVLILLAPYTVTFEDGQYAVNLVGANSNVGDRVNVNQVSVRSANSAGLAQTSDIEYASFNGAVHIDTVNGNDAWKGNDQFPVKTVERALEVMVYRGFKEMHFTGELTIGGTADFEGCIIRGTNRLSCILYVESGANVNHCLFEHLTLSGTLDHYALIKECVVGDLTYVEADIHGCELQGILTIAGSEGLEVFNCYSGRKGPVDPAILDMDGPNTGAKNVAIHNWSGHMRVRNMTAGFLGISASGSCHIRLENTCTGGFIHIMGNAKLINQSAGSTVRTNYMTDPATIAQTLLAQDVNGESVFTRFADMAKESSVSPLTGKVQRMTEVMGSQLLSAKWLDFTQPITVTFSRPWADLNLSTLSFGYGVISDYQHIFIAENTGVTQLSHETVYNDVNFVVIIHADNSPFPGGILKLECASLYGPMSYEFDLPPLVQGQAKSWDVNNLGQIFDIGGVVKQITMGSGGGTGDASWSQELPNGYTEPQAGWTLADIHDMVSSFQKQLELLLSKSYQAGSVAIPTFTAPGETLTLFAGNDYDDVTFTLGPQWKSYLTAPNAECWFTVKANPRQRVPTLDLAVDIADPDLGIVKLDILGSDLGFPAGSYFWQIQVLDVSSTPEERRVALEGTLYMKPTFKV